MFLQNLSLNIYKNRTTVITTRECSSSLQSCARQEAIAGRRAMQENLHQCIQAIDRTQELIHDFHTCMESHKEQVQDIYACMHVSLSPNVIQDGR